MELLLILGILGVAKLFPRVVIHHVMHKFLVLPWEEFHGSPLKIPSVCEVTVDALVSNS